MFGALSIGDSSRLNQQGATTDTKEGPFHVKAVYLFCRRPV